MGINTGYCNVGNFGSDDRMDYTIIGAEANLAARLQSIAEPGGICLSYETYALVRDIVRARPLPPIAMKGISREVVPYAVEGLLGELAQRPQVISEHATGLDLFLDLDAIDENGDRARQEAPVGGADGADGAKQARRLAPLQQRLETTATTRGDLADRGVAHRRKGRDRGHWPAGSKSSTKFPDGSIIRICEPPGPLTMSLRNRTPAARIRVTSPAKSSTMRWMRFQPPGRGCSPSDIGRPAELAGPLSSSRKAPRRTSAKAGAWFDMTSKPR